MATPEHTYSYNTWHQFVRACDQTNQLNPQTRVSRDRGNGGWAGTDSWEETMDLASRGWPEGLKAVRQRINITERFISHKQPRKELVHSVRGPGILDLDRYQQGRPDAWVTWELRDQQEGMSALIVPIVFNVSASSGVSKEVLFNRGAAVCALADLLEHSHIRVEILIAECAAYGVNRRGQPRDDGEYLWKVMLKHSEDVLDMDRVAFALCNASVLRRMMFSMAEQHIPHLPMSYGRPRTYREDGAINLDAASLAIQSESDMVPWLIKQLANYGIEAEV